jgi:hypothetical protein
LPSPSRLDGNGAQSQEAVLPILIWVVISSVVTLS